MIKGDEEDGSGPQTRRRRHPSFKGLAYLASANFLAKGVILLSSFIDSLLTYQMVVIYGAHLDTHILLFFQSVFAVPVFLLGILLFLGIEKESFNLVLYPSLMLLFLVLLRYGAELALIFIHWEDHPDITIALHFGIDLIAIGVLLLYVYFCLASSTFRPIPPTPLDPEHQARLRNTVTPTRKAPAPPPPEEEAPVQPPPRPPPSPKFNYKLRRRVGQIDSESPEGAMLEELDKQKQRNSAILMPELEEEEEDEGKKLSPEEKEKKAKTQSLKVYETEPKRRSLLLETDLDAKDEGNKKDDGDVKKTGDEGDEGKVGGEEEEEEDGEWEWEYEEEEEDETKKDEERRDPSPSPQILSSSFKTTAV